MKSSPETLAYQKEYRERNKAELAKKRRARYLANPALFAERNKGQYAQKRTQHLEQKKVYYLENKEAIADKKKKYHKENAPKLRAAQKISRAKNADAIRAKKKEHYQKNADSIRAKTTAWRKANPEKVVEHNRRLAERARTPEGKAKRRAAEYIKKYGITIQDYEDMYLALAGHCPICGVHRELLYVDHNHSSGVVRGLLCNTCNQAVGLLKDSRENMQRAAMYLAVS